MEKEDENEEYGEKKQSSGMNESVERIFKRCSHSRGSWATPVRVGWCECVFSLVVA